MSDAEQAFLSAMRQRGLSLGGAGLKVDGQIHRIDVSAKGSAGSKDGAYLLRIYDNHAVGGFINWTDGHPWEKWHFKRRGWQPTAAEQRQIGHDMEQARSVHERELATARAGAREKANGMWEAADKAWQHPYCSLKQVEPKGTLRKYHHQTSGKDQLLVPVHDEGEFLVNLQIISEEGRKTFLTGGAKQRCHYWIARPDQVTKKVICICEGWATGVTISQATEYAVAMAFDCGNLKVVAQWAHEKYPEHEIVLAADDDWKTEGGNPGLRCAREAARAVNGKVAVPKFTEPRGETLTDFNDMLIAAETATKVSTRSRTLSPTPCLPTRSRKRTAAPTKTTKAMAATATATTWKARSRLTCWSSWQSKGRSSFTTVKAPPMPISGLTTIWRRGRSRRTGSAAG
jgi:putative DNA primase/helicase